VRFTFIQKHRARWPVHVQCRVLQVSRSGYYAWLRHEPGPRAQRREELVQWIRQAHAESRATYGSPRVTAELRASGSTVNLKTVARLMNAHGIRAKTRRRFVPRTTDAGHGFTLAPNRLDRDFSAAGPNQKWVCDITYIPTGEGWLYLAVVLDIWSRRVVGWSMASHLRFELVGDALRMALWNRRPEAGLLHHSDRGVQYACGEYQRMLAEHGILCSMSRTGDCYDNALMESFFSRLKVELVYDEHYASRAEATGSIFEYLEVFYNRKRRHSALGYLSPAAFEATVN
jgi:putative transposase